MEENVLKGISIVDEMDVDDFHYSLERKHAINTSANLRGDAHNIESDQFLFPIHFLTQDF